MPGMASSIICPKDFVSDSLGEPPLPGGIGVDVGVVERSTVTTLVNPMPCRSKVDAK